MHKKYDPRWSGYMGSVLNGNVGINQLRPQHEFFDAIGMEKALSDNEQYHAVMTVEDARKVIDDLTFKFQRPQSPGQHTGISRPEDFSRGVGEQVLAIRRGEEFARGVETFFKTTDILSTYAGSIHDSRALYDVIADFKKMSIKATLFVGENGSKFILNSMSRY